MGSEMNFATLKPLFESASIQKALLIDDAFDPPSQLAEDVLQKAFSLIEGDDGTEQAWLDMGGKWPASLEEIGVTACTQLVRDSLEAALASQGESPAKSLARHLIGHAAEVQAGKLEPLEALKTILSEVGIMPTVIGSTGKPDQKYPLIFLDYYLGDDQQPSIDRSIDRIKDLLVDYTHDEMPIVVLMSSLESDPGKAEDFRSKAELLGCQYKFVKKHEFTDAAFQVVSSLADRAEHLSQARDLSHFVKTWRESLNNAIDTFTAEIKSLDLQDFYFIWKKAGDGKNQRFGEHVSGMFENYLRKLMEDQDDLKTVQRRVNGLTFPKMPPSPTVPSSTVARFAHASAFKDLEPFPDDHKVPPLGVSLGDVFISETIQGKGVNRKTVLSAMIVISQSCDLEHGKVGTVLMVEGTVQRRSAAKSVSVDNRERILRLDIFHYKNNSGENEDFIVEWDAQKLRAYSSATFHDDMRKEKFQRVARMRSVQALAMQQKFSAQLTRVGMPDAMPIYRFGGLEVKIRDKENGWRQLITLGKKDECACVVGEESDDLILTEQALDAVRKAVGIADETAYADGAVVTLRTELNEVVKLRRLRQVKLQKGKITLGPLQLADSPFSTDEIPKIGKKVLMTINFKSE